MPTYIVNYIFPSKICEDMYVGVRKYRQGGQGLPSLSKKTRHANQNTIFEKCNVTKILIKTFLLRSMKAKNLSLEISQNTEYKTRNNFFDMF